MSFKADLFDDLSGLCNLASPRRVNMLKLQHDRTGHWSENILIAAHKGRLITGIKFSDKEPRKFALKDKLLCEIYASAKTTRVLCHSTSCARSEARTLEITAHATLLCLKTVSLLKGTKICWHSRTTLQSGAEHTR